MKHLAIAALVLACGAKTKPSRCQKQIAGLPLAPGHLVWFGEMHGTEESPRFVGDVACLATQLGRVQVGLEIPAAEQRRIDRYLASQGTEADRNDLLAGTFWAQKDGRSSLGMLALVERVRALRAAGAKIALVAYDVPGAGRDREMAEEVARRRDPKAIFVGLSGNVHSRKIKGTEWDPELVPTVAHLVAKQLPITTYNVSPSGGEMWACMGTPDHEPECGVHPIGGDANGEPWTLGPPREPAHDGVYFVGKTTASKPARP